MDGGQVETLGRNEEDELQENKKAGKHLRDKYMKITRPVNENCAQGEKELQNQSI